MQLNPYGRGSGKRLQLGKNAVNLKKSLASKENKKGLSHFNLNGNGILGIHKRSQKGKNQNKNPSSASSNFNFSVLKKNAPSKQKVMYSSLNQSVKRLNGLNRSQK